MSWAPGYREWPPPRQLRRGLACLWVQIIPAGRPQLTLVLPDGCTDLIWQQDHGAFIAGPDTGPVPAYLPAGTVLVGARFRPGAGGPALGLPLSEILDQRVDWVDVGRARARWLPGALGPDEAGERLARLADALLSDRPPDGLVLHAARLLAAPRTTVDALGRELQLSERQLRRRFQAAVGYGPKTLQRVLRFRQVLSALDAGHGEGELAQLAFEAGYSDQAHLTRETVRLAGLPPAALARTRIAST